MTVMHAGGTSYLLTSICCGEKSQAHKLFRDSLDLLGKTSMEAQEEML